jgi:hypothetical protein
MAQFTESQLATIKAAAAFLAETQQAHHSHVAADVQDLLDALNGTTEAPAKAKKAKVEEVVVEETPAAE